MTDKEFKMSSSKQAQVNPPTSLGSIQRTQMPEKLAEMSYDELELAWRAFNDSEIAHAVRQLNYTLNNNSTLSQWEIDQVNKVYEKFSAKYNSPLAKALK
jgi:biotin-(acetyl-CoA carboxylase) ligase